jgi:hypothetical protein
LIGLIFLSFIGKYYLPPIIITFKVFFAFYLEVFFATVLTGTFDFKSFLILEGS